MQKFNDKNPRINNVNFIARTNFSGKFSNLIFDNRQFKKVSNLNFENSQLRPVSVLKKPCTVV